MADVWVKTGTFITPASGTTVIDITSKGNNAKAILLWGSSLTSNDTNQVHAANGYGFSDGAVHHTHYAHAEQGANDTHRNGSSAACPYLLNGDAEVVNVVGTCAMNANNVTISYSTFEAGWIVHYMIFGGADCNAEVNVHESNASNSPFTGLTFTPDIIFASTHGTGIDATSQHSYVSLGCAHDNGSSIDQWILATYMGANNVTPKGSVLMSGEIVGQIDLAFTNWYGGIATITTTGFTWTNPGGTGGSDDWSTLCIDFAGEGVDVGTFTKPTGGAPATGALPDLGFTPQAYFLASAGETTEADNAANDSTMAVGAYDGSDQICSLATAQDNDNTDCHQRSNNSEVMMLSADLDTNGVEALGTAQALTDATPDIIWDPNTSNADIIGYVAFAAQVSGDIAATPDLVFSVPTADLQATGKLDATPDLAFVIASADLIATGKLDASPAMLFTVPSADLVDSTIAGAIVASPAMILAVPSADLKARGKLDGAPAIIFMVPSADLINATPAIPFPYHVVRQRKRDMRTLITM